MREEVQDADAGVAIMDSPLLKLRRNRNRFTQAAWLLASFLQARLVEILSNLTELGSAGLSDGQLVPMITTHRSLASSVTRDMLRLGVWVCSCVITWCASVCLCARDAMAHS